VEWDTLLFFYGAMMMIGALGFIGYLDAIAHFLFGQISTTVANIMIGLSSAFIDNIPNALDAHYFAGLFRQHSRACLGKCQVFLSEPVRCAWQVLFFLKQ